jgi:hypothetical protein
MNFSRDKKKKSLKKSGKCIEPFRNGLGWVKKVLISQKFNIFRGFQSTYFSRIWAKIGDFP